MQNDYPHNNMKKTSKIKLILIISPLKTPLLYDIVGNEKEAKTISKALLELRENTVPYEILVSLRLYKKQNIYSLSRTLGIPYSRAHNNVKKLIKIGLLDETDEISGPHITKLISINKNVNIIFWHEILSKNTKKDIINTLESQVESYIVDKFEKELNSANNMADIGDLFVKARKLLKG